MVSTNFKKNGQIFMFDLILSMVVLLISVGLIFSYYTNSVSNIDSYGSAKFILSSMSTSKINTLNSEFVRALFLNNEIRDIESSILEQAAEFQSQGKTNYARNLTYIFVENYITPNMNINITLSNSTVDLVLYNYSRISKDEAKIVAFASRTVFGFSNATNMFGFYNVSVEIWS